MRAVVRHAAAYSGMQLVLLLVLGRRAIKSAGCIHAGAVAAPHANQTRFVRWCTSCPPPSHPVCLRSKAELNCYHCDGNPAVCSRCDTSSKLENGACKLRCV